MPPGLCPNVAGTGTCTTPDCQYRHSAYHCELCRVSCVSQNSLIQHNNGRQHKKNLAGPVRQKRCGVCDVVLSGDARTIEEHQRGARHRQGVSEYNAAGMPVPDLVEEIPDNTTRCTMCNKNIPNRIWSKHLQSPLHRRKERFVAYKVALEEGEKDKHGVVVEETKLDYGVVEVDSLGERPTVVKDLHLKLTERGAIRLTQARVSSSVGVFAAYRQVNFSARLSKPFRLVSGTTYILKVTFDPQGNRGHYEDRLELVFEDYETRHSFAIVRPLKAVVGVQADYVALAATAPYVRPKPRAAREEETDVVPGVPPPALAKIEWAVHLPFADIPAYIWPAIDQPSIPDTVRRVQSTLLPKIVSPTTYAKHWKVLLWLDEIQATKDITNYDMDDVQVEGVGQGARTTYYYFKVPGLAEKRPSVIVGDKIIISPPAARRQQGRRWFEGYVHKVEQLQVALVFGPAFHTYARARFDVRFRLSRLPLRRMHQALETSFLEPRVLFPTRAIIESIGMRRPSEAQMRSLRPYNKSVSENEPQWLAVNAITCLRPGSVPFVVFGPPGTGKTVTIIEAMRQILDRDPAAKILACAPSNSAADIIAERLARDLRPNVLFRMNAPSRLKDTLPMALREHTISNDDDTFSVPSKVHLMRFRVIVSTCLSASVPYGMGVPRGHFTHVFIDEAGQAMEPEAMIPVKTAAGVGTNIVLSGDPKQLGPIIRSAVAQKLGLGTSWLDRLMSRPEYDPHKYRGITVVKLIKNWRSHPAILRFPNEEFYGGELEAHGDPVITHSCLRWEGLPSNSFPILFHAIKGKDERQATSPSFFNVEEVSAVRGYLRDLKEHRKLGFSDDSFGVISPYNAQCQKIRSVIRNSYPKVKVGSVEEFQGQERRIIIISTVRSSMDYVTYDLRHTLGFVSNPRRFNVAITRAQALVIIVGDPDVLGLDPLWRSFLNYIHRNGGWKGRAIGWNPTENVDRGEPGHSPGATVHTAGATYGTQRRMEMETEMDELVARVRSMVLNHVPVDEDDVDDPNVEQIEANADRPWREVE